MRRILMANTISMPLEQSRARHSTLRNRLVSNGRQLLSRRESPSHRPAAARVGAAWLQRRSGATSEADLYGSERAGPTACESWKSAERLFWQRPPRRVSAAPVASRPSSSTVLVFSSHFASLIPSSSSWKRLHSSDATPGSSQAPNVYQGGSGAVTDGDASDCYASSPSTRQTM